MTTLWFAGRVGVCTTLTPRLCECNEAISYRHRENQKIATALRASQRHSILQRSDFPAHISNDYDQTPPADCQPSGNPVFSAPVAVVQGLARQAFRIRP